MGPKINGYSIAELVSSSVDRQLEKKFGDYNNLLTGALARIASLEEELAQSRQSSNNSFISNSNPRSVSPRSNSSEVCRHWLRNRCTWTSCRFRHGSATTTSLSDPNAKDSEEVVPKDKVEKSVQVGFSPEWSPSSSSTCTIPLPSSDLPSRPNYVTGVLQPELVGAALSHNIVDEVVNHVLESVVKTAKQPAPVVDATKVVDVTKWASPVTGPCMPVSEEDEWLEDMVVEIERLEAKYGAKNKSVEEGGVLHSAQVAIPRVDFSKVKPHLHRKLPKPQSVPVQACSNDPALYNKCTGIHCNKEHDGSKHYGATYAEHDSRSKFTDSSVPFGALPGFVTSLGVVAVPDEPIGGYVYDGGSGEATKWRLHAEAVYI